MFSRTKYTPGVTDFMSLQYISLPGVSGIVAHVDIGGYDGDDSLYLTTPVGLEDILDNIHKSHIASLTKDVYAGKAEAIPSIEYFGGKLIDPEIALDIEGLTVSYDNHKNTYRLWS